MTILLVTLVYLALLAAAALFFHLSSAPLPNGLHEANMTNADWKAAAEVSYAYYRKAPTEGLYPLALLVFCAVVGAIAYVRQQRARYKAWDTAMKVAKLTLTQSAGAIELGASKVTNNLAVTATKDITQSGALTVVNTATFETAKTANVVLTDAGNDSLYSRTGIETCRRALRERGCLAVWSVDPSQPFERLLMRCGFKVSRFRVPAYPGSKSNNRFVWVASEHPASLPPGGGEPNPPSRRPPRRSGRKSGRR